MNANAIPGTNKQLGDAIIPKLIDGSIKQIERK